MTPEQVVQGALEWAKAGGVRIIRGAFFDFCGYSGYPNVKLAEIPACSALGAVLYKAGYDHLCYPAFKVGWDDTLRGLLGVDRSWLWRFMNGWDRGNCLTFEVEVKGETRIIHDDVSKYADKLARKWASPLITSS